MSQEPAGVGPFILDRNAFVATSFVVSKCNCGCGNTKILLLDRHDKVRASATAIPAELIRMATEAVTDPPMQLTTLS